MEQVEITDIAKKIGISVKEFCGVVGSSPQALNYLKQNNKIKYEVQTLGIVAKYLGLSYDNLIMMSNLKKQVKDDQ